MKRIIVLMAMAATLLGAHAQQGLHVNELFSGRIIPKEHMMETVVRGKMIAKYQLSYFHSLRFIASADELARIKELVEKDKDANGAQSGGEAHLSIMQRSESGKEATTYLLRLKPRGDLNRYLCYKSSPLVLKKNEVTVIYMEGALPSLEKLKSILQVTVK
ncbi:MAG: hypothetical protein IJ604_13880 [Prevotella sp.]|nr:hypothetical protein [Prevotella sp.]